MTALSDAELAVAEARRDVHEWFVLLAASRADQARAAVARLEAAIRRHDAEVAREVAAEAREETLRLAAGHLRKKHGVTNRAAGDLLRLAELEAQGHSALFTEETS